MSDHQLDVSMSVGRPYEAAARILLAGVSCWLPVMFRTQRGSWQTTFDRPWRRLAVDVIVDPPTRGDSTQRQVRITPVPVRTGRQRRAVLAAIQPGLRGTLRVRPAGRATSHLGFTGQWTPPEGALGAILARFGTGKSLGRQLAEELVANVATRLARHDIPDARQLLDGLCPEGHS